MITVSPESFTMVEFDHGTILALVTEVAETVSHDPAVDISLEIDQDVPLIGNELRGIDPVDIFVEGGALEDPKRIRQFYPEAARTIIGRMLLMASDRRSEAFGEVPDAGDISLLVNTSWNTYVVGRLDRLGFRSQRQRRLFNFRNRHGFTDEGDAAFERLWTADELTWADIVSLSEQAQKAGAEAAA